MEEEEGALLLSKQSFPSPNREEDTSPYTSTPYDDEFNSEDDNDNALVVDPGGRRNVDGVRIGE